MTHKDTQALRADIAREVMGWTQGSRSWAYSGSASLWYDSEGNGLLPIQSWRPDEDDRQCMQVLDRMRALGYGFSLRSDGDSIEAGFDRPSEPRVTCRHLDRRLAVLRAALTTVTETRRC